jgi:hypothetical protein
MCRRSDHRESAAAEIELDVEVAHLRAQLRRVERENRNLRGENEVLREAADPLIYQAPAREPLIGTHASVGPPRKRAEP